MITRFSVKNTRSYLHGNEEGKKIFDVVFLIVDQHVLFLPIWDYFYILTKIDFEWKKRGNKMTDQISLLTVFISKYV